MRAGAGVMCVVASLAWGAAGSGCGSTESTGDPEPTADAEADARAADGPAPELDGGPDGAVADAKPDSPVLGGRYCTKLVPAPKFCDDFDDGDLTNDWTQSAAAPGAVFELDDSSSTSAPASFHVVAKPIAAATSNNVLLRSTMFGAVTHAKLAFSLFVPSVTFTKGTIAIAQFYVTLNDVYTLYLRGPDDAANIPMLEEVVSGNVTRHMLTKLPPVGVWTRVSVDLDLTNGKANVSFDAQKALDAEPITTFAGSEATVRLGAIVDGPADQFEARFDDVVIDY
ncbi:MAG: hypothetical protein JWP87_3519 [Labilithrix sp.]|nr:hypothetical protein [Labilithrix sp.]